VPHRRYLDLRQSEHFPLHLIPELPLLGALIGAVLAAGGVGIVAVLVLRAQAEWRKTAPGDEPEPPGG